MKFGVRECANIVFRAKQPIRIGTATFQTGQPVLYIDTATTSSMEQATTTVYAQGGRGNARLLAWEGQKTLTFSFTDALLSPIGFAILSGAGIFKRGNGTDTGKESEQNAISNDLVHFHMTSGANFEVKTKTVDGSTVTYGEIDLRNAIAEFGTAVDICVDEAPIYIMKTEEDGSLTGEIISGTVKSNKGILTVDSPSETANTSVMVDYYIDLPGKHVYEADIAPETFGGNYYVEADTLFRDQHTGKDLPANLTFPNVKLQSNFTMTFAGTGDPSTFDFTMDAFPDYTYFDKTKKVLAVMQIVDSIKLGAESAAVQSDDPVMYHNDSIDDASVQAHDSNKTTVEKGANVSIFKWKDSDNDDDRAQNLPHVKDAIYFGNYVTIIENGKEKSLSEYAPKFTATYGTSQSHTADASEYVEVSDDGYIVAKKKTLEGDAVYVTCELEAATNAKISATGAANKDLTLKITIGAPAVAQG